MRLFAVTIAVLTSLLLASHVPAAGERSGTATGNFAGIEQGDYAYLQLKTGAGEPQSFMILQVDKSVQSFVDNPKKLMGRKIRVHWRERMENIPDAGGKTKVKVVERIELQK